MPTDDHDVATAGYVPPPLPASIPIDDSPPTLPRQETPLTAQATLTVLPVG